MPLSGEYGTWKSYRKIGAIRDVILDVATGSGHTGTDCITCTAAYAALEPRIGVKPINYAKRDRRGGWIPKPRDEAERLLRNEIREIHAYITDGPSEPSEAAPEPKPEPAPEPKPETIKPRTITSADGRVINAERFYREVQRRRAFVRGRPKMESLDSMRIIIDGTHAIMRGLPVEALISAIEAPWTGETRRQAAAYRPTEADLKPVLPEGTYDYTTFAPRPSESAHANSEYVAVLVQAGVPVWLHGPAGTGKSSAARYAAEQFGHGYFEVNLAGAMVSAVKGKDRLKEFVESDFTRAYEHGGVVCLEEFDSAHPTVGTALNTALAGPGFFNDADGRYVEKHENFRCIVTANSLGYGSAEFKRQDLDAATKDRFRIGRVYTGLDLTLERTIFEKVIAKYTAAALVAA